MFPSRLRSTTCVSSGDPRVTLTDVSQFIHVYRELRRKLSKFLRIYLWVPELR